MSGNLRREGLEKKWEGIIKGWAKSSLSFDSYIQSQQVSKSSFYKWQKRLTSSSKAAPSLSFIELPPMAEAPDSDLFSVEVGVSKGGYVKMSVPFAKMVELVKALL